MIKVVVIGTCIIVGGFSALFALAAVRLNKLTSRERAKVIERINSVKINKLEKTDNAITLLCKGTQQLVQDVQKSVELYGEDVGAWPLTEAVEILQANCRYLETVHQYYEVMQNEKDKSQD